MNIELTKKEFRELAIESDTIKLHPDNTCVIDGFKYEIKVIENMVILVRLYK